MFDFAQPTVRLRIIVADDNDLVRDVVRDLLEHATSAECRTAHDIDEALEIAATSHFDLALLDYNMPGMEGLEGLRRLKEYDVKNFALLSGQISSETIDEAISLGVSGFLPKTLDPHAIVEAVQAMCTGEKFAGQHFLSRINRI